MQGINFKFFLLFAWCGVCIGLDGFGQEVSRIQIGARGGRALPMGAFAHQDFTNSVNLIEETYYFGAFYKEGNGYAENGSFLALDATYRMNEKLLLGAGFYATKNSVDITDAIDYHVTHFGRDGGQHDPYRVSSGLAHVGYSIVLDKLELVPKLMAGLGHLQFTDYRFGFPSDRPSPYWGHYGEKEGSYALMLGAGFSVIYWFGDQIGISANSDFLWADFSYSMNLRSIPGGSGSMQVDDKVNYRVMPLSLGLNFRF
jgi:hypothetical protein